ncbi:uncharacterized protein EDB91DRAFT_1254453 [Suillus paluster]|uniref:uncharacterized protein n=1 Tax=Suillus paluster TaxID=48578 RepID=UPI001B85E2DC|nr:uncharacterized protein EDB91DRAFT_1254453 [Suillus paluster]KAG1726194.1 hypothetical protein EDB91DRAFT_1254453 [Suillus paluster]
MESKAEWLHGLLITTEEYLAKKFTKFPDVQEDWTVVKIFWVEEQQTSESNKLREVSKIAEKQKTYYKFENITSAILETLGVPEQTKGSRVLYITVFRKLRPITELQDEKEVSAARARGSRFVSQESPCFGMTM